MIRKIVIILVIMPALVTGLFACSGSETSGEVNSVVVVSPHPVDFMRPLINEFETQTGITVKIIECGTSEAISRIQAGEAIDVLWGGSVLSVGPFEDSFAEYRSANYDAFSEEFKKMPGTVTCFTDVPSVLMVNTDLIGDIKIEGYEDLLDPRLTGKIAYANPKRSSSSFEHLVNMLYAMGDGDPEAGWDYAGKFAYQLDGNLLKGSSEVYKGVANGKFVVGLTFEEAAITQMRAGKHVKIVYMKEGVVSTPDGLYIAGNATNLENARKFVDFMTDKDTQKYISADLGRRSVRCDVEESALVSPKEEINIIEVDGDTVTARKAEWSEKFAMLCGEGDDE